MHLNFQKVCNFLLQFRIKKFNTALSDYKKSGEYKRLLNFYFGDIEKQS